MVGSVPYILAQHFAARPWIAPSESSHDTAGNNFFTWDSSSEGEFPLIVITDEDDHLTLGYILLPAFIGEGGVIYHENVNTVSEGGPFATVRVKGARGKVILKRGEESIELKADDKGIAVLSNVQQNEPVTVDIYGQGTAPAYSINFDCVVRGATPDTVIYEVNQSN
jgi:hypothetical protein